MSKLIAFADIVEDLTTLEEVGEELAERADMPYTEIEIFEVRTPYTIRGVRSGDVVDYIVQEITEEDDGTEDTQYHMIYNNGYIEYHLTAEAIDAQYVVEVVTTVRIFPLN